MKRNYLIFFMLLSSFWAFAQPKNEPKNEHTKIPDGKWVLKDIVAFEKNVQVPFIADNLGCCEVPAAIEVQQDELTFVRKDRADIVNYNAVVRENGICFPIYAEWIIIDSKLLLQWTQDIDDREAQTIEIRTIIMTYSRN